MAVAERIPGLAGKIAGKQIDTDTGALSWAMQRFTALLVGIFIVVHLWLLHFTAQATSGEPVTLISVRERMASPWYFILDVLLLASLLYHSLNGLRSVLIDWGVGSRSGKVLSGTLLVIGILLLVYGIWALIPFTLGQY